MAGTGSRENRAVIPYDSNSPVRASTSGLRPRCLTVPNYCGMWIAIHGLPVELDYESRPDDPAAWNYWTYGIETPQTSMWRTIYASMVRSVDFLATRPEVDVKRIMSSGGSQGGGLSLVLAGLDKTNQLCCTGSQRTVSFGLDCEVQAGLLAFRHECQTSRTIRETIPAYFELFRCSKLRSAHPVPGLCGSESAGHSDGQWKSDCGTHWHSAGTAGTNL